MAKMSADMWRRKANDLCKLLQDGSREEKKMSEALGYLSSLMYPLEGLSTEVINSAFSITLTITTVHLV